MTRQQLQPKSGEQQDLLVTSADKAEPWRVAAQTALHDPHFTEADRKWRHDYFMGKAEAIERGEPC